MRTAGSLEFLEYRRHVAVRLVHNGLLPTEVAEVLDVSPRSVQRWWQAWELDGEQALRPHPLPGRPPKLTQRREAAVLAWLEKDARDFGFATQQWTSARVGAVIERHFGVHFHERYLQQWLSRRRVTPQVPEPVSRERDPAGVAQWLACHWRAIKKEPVALGRRWSSPTKPAC